MRLRVVLLALSLWATSGCDVAKDVELADSAVGVFHQKYAAAVWGDVYEQATDELRSELGPAEFASAFAAVHARLGMVQKARRIGFQVTDGSEGAFVELEYDTQFEHGRAIEQFVWRITKGKARLMSYTATPATK
jgi:hypothetical protein